MTSSARILALSAAAGACLGAVGCGGDDTGEPIPGAKAKRLEQRIDAVQQAVDGQCDGLAARLAAVQTTIATLDDDGVGTDVQDALADGAENLRTLAERECTSQPEEEDPETTPETTPVPVPTTPEPTTPEPTTPEPTTPEPTTPEPAPIPEEPEPDEGDGAGQFEPDGKIPPGQAKKDGDE